MAYKRPIAMFTIMSMSQALDLLWLILEYSEHCGRRRWRRGSRFDRRARLPVVRARNPADARWPLGWHIGHGSRGACAGVARRPMRRGIGHLRPDCCSP